MALLSIDYGQVWSVWVTGVCLIAAIAYWGNQAPFLSKTPHTYAASDRPCIPTGLDGFRYYPKRNQNNVYAELFLIKIKILRVRMFYYSTATPVFCVLWVYF